MTVRSTFVSSDGDGYELQMGRWSRRLAPLLIGFAGIGGSVRVLDVGCGTGNLSSCLAQNPEIVSISGLDISQAYIEHAIHRNGDRRLDFQVGDACALPFRNASFDHTVSMLALQFVPGADLAVRECVVSPALAGLSRPPLGIRAEGSSPNVDSGCGSHT